MDLRSYDIDGSIFESFWVNDYERHSWADDEVFNVNYHVGWTRSYMIGLLRHYPSEFNEVAYRYEEGEHWWHELCYFTSNLMKNQAYDVEDFIPRQ